MNVRRDLGAIHLVAWLVLGAATAVVACSSGESGGGGSDVPAPSALACAEDAECEEDMRCDPIKGCVACLFDSDCPEGKLCEQRACVRGSSCSSDVDCADTDRPACDAERGFCVACMQDADCPDAHACNGQRCVAYQTCVNSRDCGPGEVCDRARERCVECVADGDCSDGFTCVADECVSRCDSDKACKDENLLCDVNKGHCVECVAHVDCPDVYHCADGRCLLDTCEVGQSSCLPNSPHMYSCSASGAKWEVEECADSTGCTPEGDGEELTCAPWVCEPGEQACDEAGETLQVCAANGLGFKPLTSCADEGGVCDDGSCKEVQCEAGKRFCKDDELYRCDDRGLEFVLHRDCRSDEYCDEESRDCLPMACDPDQPYCDGDVVKQCNADGTGAASTLEDCATSGQACWQGACLDQVCSGDHLCQGGDVYSCVDNGTRVLRDETCRTFEYCDAAAGQCKQQVCEPGELACNGEVVATCNADGSGFLPGGTDCDTSGKNCWRGECLEALCPEGVSRVCQGTDSYATCYDNNTRVSNTRACWYNEYCEPTTGECEKRVCTPNAETCDGDTTRTCNALGSGFVEGGTDCSLTDKVCASGACLPVICEGDYFCQDGDVYACENSGATTRLVDSCYTSQHCVEGEQSCQTDVCDQGEPVCNGDLATTCAADGSGPEPGGTDCMQGGQACDVDSGTCKDIICTPDADLCAENHVQTCNSSGTGYSRKDYCNSSEFCDDSGASVVCRKDICAPGAATCDGETLATCGSDGGSYVDQSTNCSASGKVCSLDPHACVSEVSESIGDDSSSISPRSGDGYYGNYYEIVNTRKLTEIEAYVSVLGTSLFKFLVYESDTSTGSYSKISETTVSSSGENKFHSSGAIDVTLHAGKFYYVAVYVDGSHAAYRDEANCCLHNNYLSFGVSRGSRAEIWSISSPPSSVRGPGYNSDDDEYYQRLTTAHP